MIATLRRCRSCRVALQAIYFASDCPACRQNPRCDLCKAPLNTRELVFGRLSCDDCRYGELQVAKPEPDPEIIRLAGPRGPKKKNAR
jgi:hypothetical protein